MTGAGPHGTQAAGPSVPFPLEPDEVTVVVVDLSDVRLRAITLVAALQDTERSAAARFARPGDRRRYEAAHVGLRAVLAAATCVGPDAVTIARAPCVRCGAPHGKPVLADRPDIGFSLAHAGDVALVAVGPVAVGVDIEPTGGRPSANLHRHICTAGELGELRARGWSPLAVLRAWTRKEAVLKATGEGLNRDPRTVEVGLGGPATVEGCRVTDVDVDTAGYVGALAWEGSGPRRVRSGVVIVDGRQPTCVLGR